MNQEQLNQLIKDAIDLHSNGDIIEVGYFLGELAYKYKLKFNLELFIESNSESDYFNNILNKKDKL